MNILRYLLAVSWTAAWSASRILQGKKAIWDPHESPWPVMCNRCGWCGPERWLRDVVYCPRCGASANQGAFTVEQGGKR